MTVTVLRSWDMACSLSGCLWPAYRWLGREHGRTIPLPDLVDARWKLSELLIFFGTSDSEHLRIIPRASAVVK